MSGFLETVLYLEMQLHPSIYYNYKQINCLKNVSYKQTLLS